MDDRLAKGIDRRTFLRMLGIASGVLFVPGAIACGGSSSSTPTTSSGASTGTSAATNASTAASTATTSSGTGSIATPSAASTAAMIASPTGNNGGSPAFSTFESGAKVTADIPFYNGTLTVDMLQNPQGLDPQVNTNNESFMAMLELYEQLIDYDPQSDMYYPQLVEAMPDVSNPQVYSFKLRQGIKFTDGSELTTADVKDTFDYILKMGPKAPPFSLYNSLDNVEIHDAYAFTMNLKTPNAMFIPFLSSIMGGIVKKGARDKQDLTRDPTGAGCGPFKLVEWVNGDHISYERNEAYFRKGFPKFQKLVYKILVDDTARESQLLSGAIDLSGYVPKKDFDRVSKTKGFTGAHFPSTRVDYVQLNLIHELGKDVHIRRAMAFAIDNEALVQNTLYGLGTAAHGPVCPGTPFYDAAVEKVAYFDLAKAKAELALSSQPNGFSFDLLCENNPYIVQQATLIQAMLGKVNIKANVTPLEKVAYTTKIKKGDPGWFAGVSNWTSSVDIPDYQIKLVFTTNGSYQRTSYSNADVDKLVAELEQTADVSVQKANMSKIQLQMAQDMPSIWFAWEDWCVAWQDYVKGYKSVPGYYEYFDFVGIAPH
ncbi:MAG TPA: ABC transporter substrate-binding protein [Nitrolancea sp.]|nr:ABC transporter substrate-binding protein [Nitrolancea sp.]